MNIASTTASRAFAVWWKDLERWSIPSSLLLRRSLPAGWMRVAVRDLVRQVENRVKVEAASEYKMAGVKWYGEGVFHRETVRGDEMSASQVTPLVPGALIYNRLFAWKASFAIVPTEFADCYVSSEFPQFVPDTTQILPEYLYLFCTREATIRAVNIASTGSAAVSRNRFKEDRFLAFEIPLPPLAEQDAIVAHSVRALAEIAAARARILSLESESQKRFLTDLGLQVREHQKEAKAFALWWKDLARWGVAHGQRVLDGLEPEAGKYRVVTLGDVIADLENGWSPKCLPRPAEDGEWGVLKLGAVSYGYYKEKENKALPKQLVPIPALEVKKGDVLISRANITRLVGACAIVTDTRRWLMLCDKIFRVVFRDDSLIDPAYLSEALKIPQVRCQIEAAATGTSATMQNITKPSLLALRLPLPPIDVQRDTVRRVTAARAGIAREREATKDLTKEIEASLEALILGTKTLKDE